jgi:hypothetical protein
MRRRDFLLGCRSASLAGLTPIGSSAGESSSGRLHASTRGLVRPRLTLSTDFRSPYPLGTCGRICSHPFRLPARVLGRGLQRCLSLCEVSRIAAVRLAIRGYLEYC